MLDTDRRGGDNTERRLAVYAITILLVLISGITATAKKPTPNPPQDNLVCEGMSGDVSSSAFMMKGTYEAGSWTNPKTCRIWPEEGDARAEFSFPDGSGGAVTGWGQIWQLDRSQLKGDPRCFLHILMDDGDHYRVRQLASDGLVMEYEEASDAWFFQFNNAELWNNEGYVANVCFEFTVTRT